MNRITIARQPYYKPTYGSIGMVRGRFALILGDTASDRTSPPVLEKPSQRFPSKVNREQSEHNGQAAKEHKAF